MTATDRQYIVARRIIGIADTPTEYPSAEWEAARSNLVGYAVELANLVLEDESPSFEGDFPDAHS